MTVAIEAIAADAYAVRQQNFPDEMVFHAPGLKRYQTGRFNQANPRAWLSISLTGSSCALQCDHCWDTKTSKAKALQGMISIKASEEGGLFGLCKQLQADGTKGVLISGGSDKNGSVPHLKHIEDIKRVKQELGMHVICHTGVVTPEMAQGLAWAGVDGAMIDIIGANETIREVYHLPLTVDDFERALAILAENNLTILPHIVMGLHYGRMLGEENALAMISRYPVSALILVILMPLINAAMAGVRPPPLEDIQRFFWLSRTTMPSQRVMLGCARPMGPLKLEIDRAAVEFGLNGIAYPAEGVVEYAESKGLTSKFSEYCCSLTWEP